MFLVNSRYRLFVETTFRSERKLFTYRWHTLSRSYGANLPSSLTWVLSSALVFSTRPPESVWGTVTNHSSQYAAFLGSVGSITSVSRTTASPLGFAPAFYSYGNYLLACTGTTIARLTYPSPSLLCSRLVVREY